MKILMSYRKSLVCGTTSENLSNDKCGCGAYMYMIGQVATPKAIIKEKRNNEQ